MFTVYLRSGSVTHFFTQFETEQEAVDFCDEHNWEWCDENCFVWDMYYEEGACHAAFCDFFDEYNPEEDYD